VAKKADVVVLVMGLSPRLEGEQMRVKVKGFKGGDRLQLGLPDIQVRLMKKIYDLGKPTVLVMLNGSAVAINWAAENIPAIVEAWYPGQAGGKAIADVLFGDYNPAGRLPVTFYKSVDQLPPFDEYDMEGRTYRYFRGYPLFPFGYGLSYTTFEYSDLSVSDSVSSNSDVPVSVTVRNTGEVDGDEVVQLYITDIKASAPVPIRSLQGFKRIFLKSGQEKKVEFTLTPRQLSLIDENGARVVEPGLFEIAVGGKQPGATGLAAAATSGVVMGQFKVTGDIAVIE
jgi:beta-glucosidase